MSITNLLFRFFIVYLALLVVTGVVLSYLGIQSNSGVNVGLLIGALYYVCTEFGKKNSRYFTKNEKILVVFGLIAVNIFVQLLLTLGYSAATNTNFGSKALIFSIGFLALLHGFLIYFIVGSIGKTLVKTKIISD